MGMSASMRNRNLRDLGGRGSMAARESSETRARDRGLREGEARRWAMRSAMGLLDEAAGGGLGAAARRWEERGRRGLDAAEEGEGRKCMTR